MGEDKSNADPTTVSANPMGSSGSSGPSELHQMGLQCLGPAQKFDNYSFRYSFKCEGAQFLQSCPTLCNLIDSSPPDSSV